MMMEILCSSFYFVKGQVRPYMFVYIFSIYSIELASGTNLPFDYCKLHAYMYMYNGMMWPSCIMTYELMYMLSSIVDV